MRAIISMTWCLLRAHNTMKHTCFIVLWALSVAASAAVTCEQLGNIAQTTEQLRNQGYALESVLAEADKLEVSDKLSKQDIGLVRKAVDQTFKRDRTPLEILQECKESRPR
jgi:hypothetical protein